PGRVVAHTRQPFIPAALSELGGDQTNDCCETSEHSATHRDHTMQHGALHRVETGVKARFKAVEARVHAIETPIDAVETPVDSFEAKVDPVVEVIEALVGPLLTHRGHDATVPGAGSREARKLCRISGQLRGAHALIATRVNVAIGPAAMEQKS